MTRILQIAFLFTFDAIFGVQAAMFSALTLTPSAAKTNFSLTGAYPSDLPSTFYSKPNGDYKEI